MFAACHNLVKGRREIEDHSSIFTSCQLRYHIEMLAKYCSRLRKPLPEVYAHSVGKFVQLHLL